MPVEARLSPRDQRWLDISLQLGRLMAAVTHDAFEELEPKFKALEKRLLASTSSRFEHLEIRRRIAEELFNQAFGNNCPWPIFGRTLRRIQRLGYSNIDRRYHIAALYALWCQRNPGHDDRQARRMLDEAERRLLYLPRGHISRTELLGRLADLRARTGFHKRP
jgi:hypothetical protein